MLITFAGIFSMLEHPEYEHEPEALKSFINANYIGFLELTAILFCYEIMGKIAVALVVLIFKLTFLNYTEDTHISGRISFLVLSMLFLIMIYATTKIDKRIKQQFHSPSKNTFRGTLDNSLGLLIVSMDLQSTIYYNDHFKTSFDIEGEELNIGKFLQGIQIEHQYSGTDFRDLESFDAMTIYDYLTKANTRGFQSSEEIFRGIVSITTKTRDLMDLKITSTLFQDQICFKLVFYQISDVLANGTDDIKIDTQKTTKNTGIRKELKLIVTAIKKLTEIGPFQLNPYVDSLIQFSDTALSLLENSIQHHTVTTSKSSFQLDEVLEFIAGIYSGKTKIKIQNLLNTKQEMLGDKSLLLGFLLLVIEELRTRKKQGEIYMRISLQIKDPPKLLILIAHSDNKFLDNLEEPTHKDHSNLMEMKIIQAFLSSLNGELHLTSARSGTVSYMLKVPYLSNNPFTFKLDTPKTLVKIRRDSTLDEYGEGPHLVDLVQELNHENKKPKILDKDADSGDDQPHEFSRILDLGDSFIGGISPNKTYSNKRRILVVENGSNISNSSPTIEKLGIEIDTAASTEEGLKILQTRTKEYDLIMLDVQSLNMIKKNRSILQKMKGNGLDGVPVVGITNQQNEKPDIAKKIGIQDWIHMEGFNSKLIPILEKYLAGS